MLELPFAKIAPVNGAGSVTDVTRDTKRKPSQDSADFQSEYVAQEDAEPTPQPQDIEANGASAAREVDPETDADPRLSDAVTQDTPPPDIDDPAAPTNSNEPELTPDLRARPDGDGNQIVSAASAHVTRDTSTSPDPDAHHPLAQQGSDKAAVKVSDSQPVAAAPKQPKANAPQQPQELSASQSKGLKTQQHSIASTAETVVTSQTKASASVMHETMRTGAATAPVPVQTQQNTTAFALRSDQSAVVSQSKDLLSGRELPPAKSEIPQPPTASIAGPALKMAPPLAAGQAGMAQLNSTVKQVKLEGISPVSIDPEQAMISEPRVGTTTQASPTGQVFSRADIPAQISRQLAEAIQNRAGQTVDVALNPRELGRVRMSISAGEAGITVAVLAERPETLDLMRRNIEELAREFQNIGYENINFAFAEGDAQQHRGSTGWDTFDREVPTVTIEHGDTITGHTPTHTLSSGVDLRL